ncbi:MAG: hypothetical protein Q4A52_03140 [Bacillota bacterium]|nr:hypothetical protein [Bacillota bacterium]
MKHYCRRLILIALVGALILSLSGCTNPRTGNAPDSYYVTLPESQYDLEIIYSEPIDDIVELLHLVTKYLIESKGNPKYPSLEEMMKKKYGRSAEKVKKNYNAIVSAVHGFDSYYYKNFGIGHYEDFHPDPEHFFATLQASVYITFMDINDDGAHEMIVHTGEKILAIYSTNGFVYSPETRGTHVYYHYGVGKLIYLSDGRFIETNFYEEKNSEDKKVEYKYYAILNLKKDFPRISYDGVFFGQETQKKDEFAYYYNETGSTEIDESKLIPMTDKMFHELRGSDTPYKFKIYNIDLYTFLHSERLEVDIAKAIVPIKPLVNRPYLEKLYSDVLDKLYDFVNSYKEKGKDLQVEEYPFDAIKSYFDNIAHQKPDFFERLGYAFEDVTNDGLPELLIQYTKPPHISPRRFNHKYSLTNGKPTLIHHLPEGDFYSALYVGEGKFLVRSGDEMSIFSLSNQEPYITLEDFYFESYDENSERYTVYKNRVGTVSVEDSEALNCSRIFKVVDDLYEYQNFAFSPFSEYNK